MTSFLYEASHYSHYRPHYPDELFNYLTTLTPAHGRVLECGCGSGQATLSLAKYYSSIIAIDASFDLLRQTTSSPFVLYVQARSEQLPLASQTIDLLCVSQALHWFSLDAFYKEVHRVLKPNAIVAAWCYNQATIEPKIDILIHRIYEKMKQEGDFSLSRQYVYDHYQQIPFPFNKIPTPYFTMKKQWNFFQLLGYIRTWPGLLAYQKKTGVDLLLEIQDELSFAWGTLEAKKNIHWTIYLLIGR